MPDIKHFNPDTALERVELLFWQHGAANASIQDVATVTGLNRSSLYSTFGGKRDLYLAALRRYLQGRSRPAFQSLAEDGRGLPALRDFFTKLVTLRTSGDYEGWGCMAVNAHFGAEHSDPEIRDLLEQHHQLLRDAMRTALDAARRNGELFEHVSIEAAAETLAHLAYGVNLRSRNGVDKGILLGIVNGTLALLGPESQGSV
ncbi:TetR/AcrR family transcriptional regulator [Streptomyces sp. NPDC055299]